MACLAEVAQGDSMSTTVENSAHDIGRPADWLASPTTSTSPRVRWENRHQRRYYEAVVQRDLFGGWELWRVWGGLGSARGGQQVLPAADERSGLAALAQVGRHRERRGYVQVAGGGPSTNSAGTK